MQRALPFITNLISVYLIRIFVSVFRVCKMATSSKTSRSEQPANKLETIHKALHDFLHQKSAVTPVFELVEKHAKLKREYLFLGGWRSRPATCN